MEPPAPKPEQPEVETPVKPVKEKKPPTEAQKAAREKGLQTMMAKRRELAAKQKEKKEEVKTAKRIVENKILKEDLAFATKQDLESMRKELMELRAYHEASKIVAKDKAVEKPAPKAERIVERVIERQAPTAPAPPAKLTGHALLDKLFFEK
jgi:hypothetical protein